MTAIATLSLMALVSILTPFQDVAYFKRWFAWPSLMFSLVDTAAGTVRGKGPVHRLE